MVYRSLPWIFVPSIILLVVAGVYVEEYDDKPWTEFSVILASIGIAVALAVFAIQTFQQGEIAELLKKSKERKDAEIKDKKIKNEYYEKMLVRSLCGLREISLGFPVLVAQNNMAKIREQWSRFKVPTERLYSLYVVGANIVDHVILDDVDSIRGSLADDLPEDVALETVVNLLSYPMNMLDALCTGRLKDRRLEVYKEDVQSLLDQVKSAKSNPKFVPDSESALNMYRNSVLRTYARRYLYPDEKPIE